MIKTYLLLFKFCFFLNFVAAQKIKTAIHWQSESLLSVQSLAISPSDQTFVGGIFQEQWNQGEVSATSKGGSDIFITQLNENGDPIWLQTGGSDRNETLKKILHSEDKITAIGTYWLTGEFDTLQLQTKGSSQSIFLLQYHDTGSINWAISIDGTGNKEINDLVVDDSGNLLLTGIFQGTLIVGDEVLGNSEQSVFFLLKFDANGQLIWSKQSNPVEGFAEGIAMTILENNQIILAGNFRGNMQIEESSLKTNTDDRDVFLASFSSEGDLLWLKKAGGVLEDRIVNMRSIGNDFFVAGNFLGRLEWTENQTIESVGLNQNIFLLAYNELGNPLWANSIGGAAQEIFSSMTVKEDRIILSGSFSDRFQISPYEIVSNNTTLDGFVLSCDLAGNPLWLRSLPASGNVLINDIAFDAAENIRVVGDFLGNAIFDEFQLEASIFNPFFLQIDPQISSIQNLILKEEELKISLQNGTIQLISNQKIVETQIFDIQGRLQAIYSKQITFNISDWQNGIYVILARTETGKTYTKLISFF